MMRLPEVQQAIQSEKENPELKHLFAQYEQSPTHGEGIGYLILQQALTPHGFVQHLRSDTFRISFDSYQDEHPE